MKRCKFGQVLYKMSKLQVFYISWNILNKRKGNWGGGGMCKMGLVSFQGKIVTIAPNFPGKMTVFQFWTYFFICPSLTFGSPTHTKVTFS